MGKKYPLHDFSQIPTFTEIAMLKAELESIKLDKELKEYGN